MIKLLLGGSPCTYWSIAQTKYRETEPSGAGWELFENYLIAKEKFKPDFFLYENNKSAAQAIKDEIKKRLNVYDGTLFMPDSGVRYIEINSALVSAQKRQRFYVHNCGEVEEPEDRGILLRDILESGQDLMQNEKAYCLTKSYNKAIAWNTLEKKQRTIVAEPIRIGDIGSTAQAHRVYSCDGKSVTIKANSGGQGGKTGLYACPVDKKAKQMPRYEVKGGKINIKGKEYPIKLQDGFYILRKLTVTECCRLQTLPDDYCRAVSKTQAYKGLGNGWTAEVIIHILNGALKDVPRDEKILVLSMYDGIGTGRYCLDKMGFKNVEYHAFEIDKYAMKIAKSNYPDIIEHGNAYQVRNNTFNIK